MAGIVNHHFPVLAALLGVRVQNGTDLLQHWLRGARLLTRVAGHGTHRAQGSHVKHRIVGNDQIVSTTDPKDGRFGLNLDQVTGIEIFATERRQNPTFAGSNTRPIF